MLEAFVRFLFVPLLASAGGIVAELAAYANLRALVRFGVTVVLVLRIAAYVHLRNL